MTLYTGPPYGSKHSQCVTYLTDDCLWLCGCAGLPVSRGEVTAKARVITSLQGAPEIQVWQLQAMPSV